jgi:hypothetical protein
MTDEKLREEVEAEFQKFWLNETTGFQFAEVASTEEYARRAFLHATRAERAKTKEKMRAVFDEFRDDYPYSEEDFEDWYEREGKDL